MNPAFQRPSQGSFSLPKKVGADEGHKAPQVWFAGFTLDASGHLLGEITSWLSPEEQAKAGRFLKSEDRDRFVLGRAFIRGLVAQRLGASASAVILGESRAGKPCAAESGLEFNVSHSGNAVLIAWSDGLPVGADVELTRLRDMATLAGIAETSFSAEECAVLSSAAEQEKVQFFHRIWVRKEALIKAEGVGLGGPLKGFSVVRLETGTPAWADEVLFPGTNRVWQLVDLEAPPHHSAALAIPHGAAVSAGLNALWQGPH